MKDSSSNTTSSPKSDKGKITLNRNSWNQIFFGLILIWLGSSIFLHRIDALIYGDWWDYFLLGVGIIFFAEVFVNLFLIPDSHLLTGKLIAGAVLIALGASDIYGIHEWWPLILIVMGILILLSSREAENKNGK
ncbi:hypothetical protein GF337_11385 [candidate division KSB1 bacterium]|nr:hypothetical protein [candidate division KSB1 bacterium]